MVNGIRGITNRIEKRINKLNQCKINEQIKEKLNNILLFYQSKVIMRKITE